MLNNINYIGKKWLVAWEGYWFWLKGDQLGLLSLDRRVGKEEKTSKSQEKVEGNNTEIAEREEIVG